jgi:4-amino-4-deoxy-L-arabinose transferase-like glycosyltransferase
LSRRFELALVTFVLLIAAALRIVGLTSLPSGLSMEERTTLQLTTLVRQGAIASFYSTPQDPTERSHEGLYPLMHTAFAYGNGLMLHRWMPFLCGLVSVALMYALTKRLFGTFAGVCAALALAVTFWAVLLSRSAIREALLLPLGLLFLLVLAHAIHLRDEIDTDPPVTVTYALVGALMAALSYTHWTGLMGLPLIITLLAYLLSSRQPISRRVISYAGFSSLVAIIFGIPYLTFTLREPQLSGFYQFWANRPENITTLVANAAQTVGAIFSRGDMHIEHNLPGYGLIGIVGVVLLLIGFIQAVRYWRAARMGYVLIILIIGLAPAAWAGADFTRMILALPALMMFIGIGADFLRRGIPALRPLRPFAYPLAFAVGIVSAIVGYVFLTTWANDPATAAAYRSDLGNLASYLDRADNEHSTTVCTFDLDNDPRLMRLFMHSSDANLRYSDCVYGLVLARGGETQRIAYLKPDEVASPALLEWLEDAEPIAVPNLPPNAMIRVDASQEIADAFGVLTQSYAEYAPDAATPEITPESTPAAAGTLAADQPMQAVLPLRMGGYLTFEGYVLSQDAVYQPGDTLTLVTYWRIDGTQPSDLRLFAHVLRFPNTEPVLQNDILSVDASRLSDRDILIQVITIPIPPNFPPGEYYMSIGAYRSETNTRFPVYFGEVERGDRLFLRRITVE